MRSLVLALIALAACADDANPHDVGSCAAGWMGGPNLMCEAACHDSPTNEVGTTACTVTDPVTGIDAMCQKGVARDGGCCLYDGASTIRLYDCK